MRRRRFFQPGIVALLIFLDADGALASDCSPHQAPDAETKADGLQTSGEARLYFYKNKACLDGPVAYGFINRLAQLAVQPGGVSGLWAVAKPDPVFRRAVLRMLPSEAVPLDVNAQLLVALRAQCPSDARSFCATLARQIRQACTACPPLSAAASTPTVSERDGRSPVRGR